MEPLKKYVTCIIKFPIPFHSTCVSFSQFFFVAFLVLFTENLKLWNERKEQILYIWLLQRITLYQGRQKISSLDKIAFLDTHVYIDSPYCESSGIMMFLCKYSIVMFFLLLARCNTTRAPRKTKKERLSSGKKSIQKNLCKRHHFYVEENNLLLTPPVLPPRLYGPKFIIKCLNFQ